MEAAEMLREQGLAKFMKNLLPIVEAPIFGLQILEL
jgi:hypothetical protein